MRILPKDLQANTYHTMIDGDLLLTTRIAYDAFGNAEYIGKSAPGSDEADPCWLIRKIIYDDNQNPVAILVCAGEPDFKQVWNDRTGLSYS
ncbi:MAG: hypothetical protein H7832_03940 [Magnetococcus sp. DMHC-6]